MAKLSIEQVKYTVSFWPLSQTRVVDMDCNAVLFVNQGTNQVTIDQAITLVPGAHLAIDGNFGERLTRQFNIRFLDTGGTNNLVVMQKIYE